MQIDHLSATRHAMQVVDVLCYEQTYMAGMFEFRQCGVRRIRSCRRNPTPASKAPGPVAFTHVAIFDKVAVLHRLRILPIAVFVAIIGNAGPGAATSAAQHGDILVPMYKFDDLVNVTHTL